MSEEIPKPIFTESPVFQVEEDDPPRKKIPRWIWLLLPLLLLPLLLIFRGEEENQERLAPIPVKEDSSAEIEKTLRDFYSLANKKDVAVCDLFLVDVFNPISAPAEEAPLPSTPGETPPSGRIVCQSWLKNIWSSPLEIEAIENIQEETNRALAIYTLGGKERAAPKGGAILVQEDNVWQVATLVGLRGLPGNDEQITEVLVEEYNQLGESSLYEIPEGGSSPKEEATKPPSEKKVKKDGSQLSCPGGEGFDFVADVREEKGVRLYGGQKAVGGGDIVSATHSLGDQDGCLSVRFAGDYRKVRSLILELYYNSWQSSSSSRLIFNAAKKQFSLQEGSQTRSYEGKASASKDGKRLRLLFPAPPGWQSSSLPFWFLRSSFSDSQGTLLFDEGRPSGQSPPSNASNLEGGWPR